MVAGRVPCQSDRGPIKPERAATRQLLAGRTATRLTLRADLAVEVPLHRRCDDRDHLVG
jgi:hypothetical protein